MDEFGKIFGFVDFGNVNHWFDKDRYDITGRLMNENEFLIVDIEKMGSFLKTKKYWKDWKMTAAVIL